MGHWEATGKLTGEAAPGAIWQRAYVDARAWPRWNDEIASARLDGPLALGATARVVFATGLRLRFRVVEFTDGWLFTDEARLIGARMGHRHLIEDDGRGGSVLTNTIYIDGPLAGLWRQILGPRAASSLPGAQRAILALAAG
jgi:hypothetical protein